MEHLSFSLALLTYVSCLFPLTSALTGQVLSTFVYTHHGERTPLVSDDDPNLTPLGARQAWQAGVNMRNRYILPSVASEYMYTIRDISPTFLESQEINILTSTDEWVTGSAQAFMQGLYPPLGPNMMKFGEAYLANGTNITAPLNGYQYPNIVSASVYDLKAIYVRATDNCPNYTYAMLDYKNDSRYLFTTIQTQEWYDSLKEPFLNGIFLDSTVGYSEAYPIWDYLSYAYIHNITVARKLSLVDRTRALALATEWMFDMYANSTADGVVGPQHIRAIAGRTLAGWIMQSFMSSIQSAGQYNKMNLVFGDYKPMMSFFALAGLMREETNGFINAPAPGSSFIFELYTYSNTTSYPKSTDMYVRFFYQNSTDEYGQLQQYYPFRASKGSPMPWGDFVAAMSSFMITDSQDWCTTCGSNSVFCSAFSQSSGSSSTTRSGLQPAVAGVIGAISALIFIGLVTALVMIIGGVRFHRQNRRKSELGGFKGTEKLASDPDLTVPKGGAGVSVHEEPRGHERVGSWELREPAKIPGVPSGIDTSAFEHRSHGLDHDDLHGDPYAIPVQPRDTF